MGAFNGDTVNLFLQGGFVAEPEQYEIFAFEVNPKYHPALNELAARVPKLTVIPKAAWISDDEIDVAIDTSVQDWGSSIMHGKAVWKTGQIIKSPAVDFSKWIAQFSGDYVVMKMDVEGAEFPILERMLSDGTIDVVARAYVEFHPNKVPEYTGTYCNDLIQRLRRRTNLYEWH